MLQLITRVSIFSYTSNEDGTEMAQKESKQKTGPKVGADGKRKQRSIYLDDAENSKAERLGKGNATKGVRKALNAIGEMSDWMDIDTAPDDAEVMTKIDDACGCRNEQPLVRQGNLWFYPDMSVYVYYRPTHWRPLDES